MTTKPKEGKSSELRTLMGCLDIDGKTYPLYEGVNTIGRHKDATVIVRDPSASQQHALITIVNENQHYLSDLRSFNGTIVENNKLNPLLLYELPLKTVIHFANCKAVYKKQVPTNSQFTTNHGFSGRYLNSTQNTQDLNESFYAAQTQALENDRTKVSQDIQGPTCNYFEDDYNFADIPSPPMHQNNQENKTTSASTLDKSGLSIHEMPTQLYCSNVANDIVIGESQVPDSSNIGYQTITTKVDVHELPTQIICHEAAVDEAVDKTHSQVPLQGPSLHDMPTQIYDQISDSKETNASYDISHANTKGDTVHDKPTQLIIKNTECKSLCNDTLDDTLQCESKSNNSNTQRKSVTDVSTDIIEKTFLDDSGLDLTVQTSQSNTSGKGSIAARLEDKAVLSLDSDPQSPLHVSRLHRRTVKPIADDTEEDDIVSSGSEIIKNKSKKKSKPFPESQELEDSNGEEISKRKKKRRVLYSDNSETDIEDLQDTIEPNTLKLLSKSSVNVNEVFEKKNKSTHNKTKDDKISLRRESSGSDTEIEEFEIQDKVSTTFENNVKMKTLLIVVGKTDTNNFKIRDRNESSNNEKVHFDNSGSDTDADGFEFDVENKVIKEKSALNLNNTCGLNETDVIPNTQVSEEDDDDDFNFMPESNSTSVTKNISEQTKKHIFDVSQELKELCKASVVPQNCSEESFHLGLSEVIEGSENAKDSEEQLEDNKNEDDDKTPDISDIDEPITESDDIFSKPTQIITIDTKVNEGNTQDIFAMDTQKLPEDIVMQKVKNDEIFAKPSTSKYFNNMKKQNESQNACAKNISDTEDDIFMQPTQPVVADNSRGKEDLFQTKHATSNEDIFMQPTQKYVVDNQDVRSDDIEDDIFLQPTQQLVSNDTLVKEPSPVSHHKLSVVLDETQPTNNIFMQPTQLVVSSDGVANVPPPLSRDKTSVESVEDQPGEDIFMQPTQAIDSTMVTKHLPKESIFLQSSQPVEVTEPKADNNDIFMQETQQIVLSNVLPNEPLPFSDCNSDTVMQHPQKHSLSLHKDSMKTTKVNEVESQLEVMFASQTLRISSQTNSRPSNPLANVLEGKQVAGSEQNSEEPEAEADDTSKKDDEDVESSKSLGSCDDLKEYCTMPTLPIDEISDFQISYQAEQKSNNKTKNRGRPPRRTTPTIPKEVNVAGTSRKRGRPAKSEVNTTLEVTSISDTTRKSRRTKKIKDVEQAIVGKVTESEESPSAGTSVRDIARQADDKSLVKRKTNANKDNIKSSKDTNRNNTHDNDSDGTQKNNRKHVNKSTASSGVEDTSSETDEEDDKQQIIKNRIRTQTKTNLKEPLTRGKRTTRNNVSEAEESSENERKAETIHNETSKSKIKGKKQNKPSSTSDKVEEVVVKEGRTLRGKKVDIISSDHSDSNLEEKSNITTPSTAKRRKVNEKTQIKEIHTESKSKILQGEAGSSNLSKRDSNIVNTDTEKNKKQPPAVKHMQTRRKTTNFETSEQHFSTDPKPSAANVSCTVVVGTRSKRLLSKDSEIKPALKKVKNAESSENEEVKSNSDNSEMDFRTSRKNKAQLSVTCSTPDRNRRMQKPKVVFTMLNNPELESLVRRLGGMVVDTVSACTVLVTGSLKRSQKLLSAVGEGKPICSPKWLQECKKANKFIDPWDYILEDEEAESKWNFNLKESLNRSQNKKLLHEFTIVLAVSDAVDVLKAAIESCGGKYVMKVPTKNVENNLVIVANPNKKATYSKFLKQKPPATVVAPEAIFDGVLRQELHWEDHMLS